MLGFSPDPELTSCVAQPPVALADYWKLTKIISKPPAYH